MEQQEQGETAAVRVILDVLVPREKSLLASDEVLAGVVASNVWHDAVKPRQASGMVTEASIAWEVVRSAAQEAPPIPGPRAQSPVAREVAPVALEGLPSELTLAITALDSFERFKAAPLLGTTGQLSIRSIRNAIVAVGEAAVALTSYVKDDFAPCHSGDAQREAAEKLAQFEEALEGLRVTESASSAIKTLTLLGEAVAALVDLHETEE